MTKTASDGRWRRLAISQCPSAERDRIKIDIAIEYLNAQLVLMVHTETEGNINSVPLRLPAEAPVLSSIAYIHELFYTADSVPSTILIRDRCDPLTTLTTTPALSQNVSQDAGGWIFPASPPSSPFAACTSSCGKGYEPSCNGTNTIGNVNT